MPAMLNNLLFVGVLTLLCSDFYPFLFCFLLVYICDWQDLSV